MIDTAVPRLQKTKYFRVVIKDNIFFVLIAYLMTCVLGAGSFFMCRVI